MVSDIVLQLDRDALAAICARLGRALDPVPKRVLEPWIRERVMTEALVLQAA
jgi:hypothetical protein